MDQRLDGLVVLGRAVRQAQRDTLSASLERNLGALRAGAAKGRPLEQRPWNDPAWASWAPAKAGLNARGQGLAAITVGEWRDVRSGHLLGLPVLVDQVEAGRPIVVRSGAGQHRAANELLQSLVVRSAVCLPVGTSYGLVDPVGGGRAFPWGSYLPALVAPSGDRRRDLDATMAEIDRRAADAGDLVDRAGVDRAEGAPLVELAAGPAGVVVAIADFPVGYDRRTVEWVQSLCRSGPTAGIHLLIHHHVEEGAVVDLGETAVVDLTNPQRRLDGTTVPGEIAVSAGLDSCPGLALEVAIDGAPPVALARRVLEQVGAADDEMVRWDELGHPDEDAWWGEDAGARIVGPIGRRPGGAGALEVTFGVDGDNRPCAHGVVVAMTGAGKTALFHTLIASLTVRYSPEELCLYLIDGKSGVGFSAYRGLPHAAVVSLRTRPDLARSVLDDLVEEMVRRNEIFKRHHVEHFGAYRDMGSPEGRLPRLLLVADEFQLLFEDDRNARAARALLRLSEQGRSAGVHLLLGSQHFAPAAMTNRNLIFANLHLRIALQMATADVRGCVDFGPEGRRLIEATCTRSGQLVANDRAGDDTRNRPATAAYLEDRRKAELVAALRSRASGSPPQVVLDGDNQPDLVDDPLIARLGEADHWPDDASLERLAGEEPRSGGLGCADWMAAEGPVALTLGQEFTVRGRAVAVLRRRRHEHLCVVGEAGAERVATMAAALVGACLQRPPELLAMLVADRSVSGAPWSAALRSVGCRARGAGYDVELTTDDIGAARLINRAAEELARRRSDPEGRAGTEKTWMVVVSEPDRVSALARQPDAYGFVDTPLGEQLGRLLDEGAEVGIHVLAAFASVGAARVVMADRRLRGGFRHRVAMQMPDDDSYIMVNSPAAARLQPDGPRPVAAVLFDRQADRGLVFKPYSLTAPGTFEAQVDAVFARLARRRRELVP
ncbi:MAG: FtsK/SpoIIIE domain-containing protein [Acidimicrobiales bacterium]